MDFSFYPPKTIVIYIVFITLSSCNTIKNKKEVENNSISNHEITLLSEADIDNFILEFDSLLYFDSAGILNTDIKIDSFLKSKEEYLKIIPFPDLINDTSKVSRYYNCQECEMKYVIRLKDFRQNDTLRRINFIYKNNKADFSSFVYEQIQYRTPVPIGLPESEANRIIKEMEKQIRKENRRPK